MESEFHSIGEMARASGLTVSALRFYDGAGVLVPAAVDPVTGYRWYAPEQLGPARLLAGLRRVGMPLVEIGRVLDARTDPPAVRRLLDAHLRRLEAGLADARRELSRIHALIDSEETVMSPTRLTLTGADLAAALDAVRFAVSASPDLPMLNGVLVEFTDGVLRLVATDRYRMALAEASCREVAGAELAVLVPVGAVDELRRLAAECAEVVLALHPDRIGATGRTADGGTRTVDGTPLDHPFPDYRRLVPDGAGNGPVRRVTVDVAGLRAVLTAADTPTVVREHDGVSHQVAALDVRPDGQVTVVDSTAPGVDPAALVAVNREFLLDALDAAGQDQLVLELDGPIAPLAVRRPDGAGTFSILMPVRLT